MLHYIHSLEYLAFEVLYLTVLYVPLKMTFILRHEAVHLQSVNLLRLAISVRWDGLVRDKETERQRPRDRERDSFPMS